MSTDLDDTDNVFDLNEAIPETELLDNNIQKGRAQLSIKARRHRPSRSCHRDSVSLTEGDDSLDRKDSQLYSACSPLHLAMRGSSPPPDSLLSARSPAFSFDTSLTSQVRHSPEDGGASLAAPPRGRYHQLTNATSQEALTPPSASPSKSCPSSKSSPVYMRRNRRPDSEVLVSDTDTSPSDPGSPTRVFDKKTKRRFLDLGVTLRRSYVRVRTEQSNRLSVRDQSPSRSFVPLSWFTEGRGSVTPPPKIPPLSPPTPRRAHSQESVLSEEFSPPHSSPPPVDSSRSSHPYHTLFSDEGLGVLSSSDRCTLKRRIKEIHAAAEKERKVLDKLEKQKAKQRRKEQEQRRN
ncbi:sterile alpha motif domain-containing protein 14 isoform X4 [Hippoglossus hippoglossus]|uniref:sterile alpha motif domain-containing protein 14 isoform X4 n=1 Tax=Hippoglossus hippoglossus TaxID=8267 RepID=UPI00148BE92E|nr:sterile alpha motif domain-containing protein 14 isoform X4 [Hippoglossus hippoglossus]